MNHFPSLHILSGSAHPALADRISEYLGVKRTDATVTAFPDGETFVKINENIRGGDVFIVQPTCPPSNHNIMELLIMVDAYQIAKRTIANKRDKLCAASSASTPFLYSNYIKYLEKGA